MLTAEATTRRSFLRVGALGLGGLSLSGLLARRVAASETGPTADTAVILIFLSGGPSQHDTFDPKPDVPEEIRGPFAGIPTALLCVRVTELFRGSPGAWTASAFANDPYSGVKAVKEK